jgi:hypothetical protein
MNIQSLSRARANNSLQSDGFLADFDEEKNIGTLPEIFAVVHRGLVEELIRGHIR